MSKPSATFDAMPPEIRQLIIAFAIGGPTSHVNLLGEELEVIADTATIKPRLSISERPSQHWKTFSANPRSQKRRGTSKLQR